jgi:ABC-type Fe3+-hydroxamate transport system substrate-binding protein
MTSSGPAAREVVDDLGTRTVLAATPLRIVSLVPSLTEALAASVPERLVGATDWCTHPADLDVPRVRGTKNPDLAAIRALAPDLVVANKEENRQLDVQRLRAAGVPVWVTDIESVDQSLVSLRRLFEVALDVPAPAWLSAAEAAWAAPEPRTGRRVAVAVWRDPWMVVGSRTFTGDVLWHLGFDNVYADHAERYPHISLDDLRAAEPDLVVLPDEPYVFTEQDGPEAFAPGQSVLVPGRLMTWYGPSLTTARTVLGQLLGRPQA